MKLLHLWMLSWLNPVLHIASTEVIFSILHLKGSSLQLRRIMVNLLSNAIKYNKSNGTIDTYAEELSCDGTTVWYEFKIVDTGIGMSEEFIKEQLFKPFTQEKNRRQNTVQRNRSGNVDRQGASG